MRLMTLAATVTGIVATGPALAQSGLWLSVVAVPGPRYGCELRMTLTNNLREEISLIFLKFRLHYGGASQSDSTLFRDLRPGGRKEEVSRLLVDSCPPDLRMSFIGVGSCFGSGNISYNNCDEHLGGHLYPSGGPIAPPVR